MTTQLEKIFFNYIKMNRKFYAIVKPYFFRNAEIQFVYEILLEYMSKSSDIEFPSPRQILDMVELEDRDGRITKPILKSILDFDLDQYSEKDFIIPKFNAWILSNRLKAGISDVIEETRSLDNISDFDTTVESANKIREIVDEMSSTRFITDDNLGSDFDDADMHVQDSSKYKIPTGFPTLDHILGKGWDIGTLNVLMSGTNMGKSLWMQNLTVSTANLGYNVLYITLEMSERKVIKRLGAMRLKIPINDYDEKSKDVDFIRKRIANLGKTAGMGDLFEKKIGKIITKFWAAGTTTIDDFDVFMERLRERRGIKIDLVVIDYMTLIAPSIKSDSLYVKGKHLAEGLRALGAKYEVPILTAVQVAKDAWNASDVTLESVPESKAIAETADTFFGIIRTPEMQRNNLYRVKLLKQRDGDFSRSHVKINLNPTYLTLEDDEFID